MTAALPKRTGAFYSLGAGPVAILGLPFTVYLPPFVAEGGVVAVALVGLLFSLSTLWDGIVDPLIGTMIDRKSKGAAPYRGWMLRAVLPLLGLLSVIVLFGNSLPFWALLPVLLLFYSSLSLYDVSHLAWGSALAGGNPDTSARLYGNRQFGMTLILLVAFAAPAIGQSLIPDISLQGRIWAYVSLLFLVVPLAIFAIFKLPSRQVVPEPGIGWAKELRLSVKSRPLMLLLAVQFCNAFAFGSLTSLFVFYAEGWLKLGDRSATLLFAVFIGGALVTPLWTWAARRFGKPQSMMAMAAWLMILMTIGLWSPQSDFPSAFLFSVALGSGFVGLIFIYGMAGDIAPHDRALCGRDRTAFLFALVNLLQKAGTASGIAISYALLDFFAFDPKRLEESAELVRNLYAGVPIAAWSILIIILWFQTREPWVNQKNGSAFALATPKTDG